MVTMARGGRASGPARIIGTATGIALALLIAKGAAAGTLVVSGQVSSPQTLDDAALGGTAASAMIGGTSYAGSSVYSLISLANFTYPGSKNGFLLDYVLVTGASGKSVLLSEGEIDPGFGGVATTDFIATQANGASILPQLIVPGDVNGGIGGRDITDVVSITVFTAPVHFVPNSATDQFTITGAVSSPANPYTKASLDTVSQVTETDTYTSGGGPAAPHGFSGVPIYTLLASAGLTTDPGDPDGILDDYVVATGSDGYAVVYSLGELDPAYSANAAGASPPLIADGGDGVTPGQFRTTAPLDGKGGRYVSGLENLDVESAIPEPGTLALLLPALALVALRRRRRRTGRIA
jgi:hypothetical protein